MKKICSRILSILLSATVVFGLVSCKKEEDSVVATKKLSTYQGTHIYTAPDTSDYLVQNGKSDYVVVIPENASDYVVSAQEEFVHLFEKATDIQLRKATDAGLTHNASARYISIGETSLLSSAEITLDKARLGQDGGRVVTKDKSVYICGGADTGTLFMVYTFMNITFNYETYYTDCMEIDTNVKNKALKAYDVTDIPDFQMRAWNNHILTEEHEDYDKDMFAERMRYVGKRGYNFMTIHTNPDGKYQGAVQTSGASTNSTKWLPPTMYNDDTKFPEIYHPKWFSTEGNELCFTARGDEEELEAMLDECMWKATYSLMKYTPDKYPQYTAMTLTQQDTTAYCRCKACTEKADRLGGIVGVYIDFMNQLAERIENWMNQPENAEYKRDDFTLLFFGYSYTKQAPVKYNAELGVYEPLIKCRHNVGVYFASGGEMQQELTSKDNEKFLQNVDNWGLVTDNIYFWFYSANHRNYMWFYDSFSYFTPEFYSHMATRSNRMIFSQGQEQCKGTLSTFNNLKVYLEAKLMWDTSLDMEVLIDKFFNAMYRESAPKVKEVFLAMRAHMQYLLVHYEKFGAGNRPDFASREYWPLALLEGWVRELDDAKKLVERYKTLDAQLYERICQHIEAECIAPIYLIIDCHLPYMTTAKGDGYINRLWQDIEWMGLENMTRSESKSDTLVEWLNGLSR